MGIELETELTLGIGVGTMKKRGYTELKLNLHPSSIHHLNLSPTPLKAQVVGWPPVRSFRKNMLGVHKNSPDQDKGSDGGGAAAATATFVKVSVDGAPYLRKMDLKMYKSYNDLSLALTNMFTNTNKGNWGGQAGMMNDFMNEKKLIIILNGSEYVPTYEDQDGDWMLLGDVPWEMFVESCKRLRLMKGSDATGLEPSAIEKNKNENK